MKYSFKLFGLDLTAVFISGDTVLQPGHHSYDFSWDLPSDLPTSQEHSIGFIRYMVEAVLDCPWESNEKLKEFFTVIKPLDLNSNPMYRVCSIG